MRFPDKLRAVDFPNWCVKEKFARRKRSCFSGGTKVTLSSADLATEGGHLRGLMVVPFCPDHEGQLLPSHKCVLRKGSCHVPNERSPH